MPDAELVAQQRHDDMDGIPPPAAQLDVVGHEAAFGALTQALDGGRMHHAWLLQGPQGIGKATLAFAFARTLLASTGEDPVAVARQVAQGSHPRLIHLSRPLADRGGGFKTQITVDETRRLMHFFHTTAGLGWRVAIVDPADDMNRNAANALLKILEEPPARSLFLIVNHMPGRLLPTIRSRCRVLRLGELQASDIAARLRKEVPDASDDEIAQASAQAMGSMRTGFQNLIGGGGEVNAQVRRLFALSTPDWAGIQALADAVTAKGREASYGVMVRELFRALGAESEAALAAGNLRAAERLAAFWQSEDARWREGEAYNLDRKQMLLTFFTGLSAARND
ncbi:DNA polymerase-3 subunit delta' [Aureimonas altamirensis DSM 21988]|uniref:DNA polymerase III subunit delta n=2 Tax=Aureimonas altamirensis TaxID=370622 RepID=A0A0P0YXD7_9HYPH|nr:DNA polymerase III subunit delta' [Aureimonas altamirensis]BAT26144.1 DNA polymerase III subunit delta [Aureimonas altamirensis]SHJ38984.1 DNA polymerase-3 subunit delta' [Aureimonas altamirensis DSM 21988]